MVTVPVHLTEIHSWVSGFHIFLMCPGVFPDFCLTLFMCLFVFLFLVILSSCFILVKSFLCIADIFASFLISH